MRKSRVQKRIRYGRVLLSLLISGLFMEPDPLVLAKQQEPESVNLKGRSLTEEPGGEMHEKGDAFLIAVTSDLHLEPENHSEGSVNPLTRYNQEIVQALLEDVKKKEADVLLICGDLVNAGRKQQHEALLTLLENQKDADLKVLVLPGNHDLDYLPYDEFPLLYTDYGYGDAYSRDEASLSYSYLTGDQFFLMLDTGGYNEEVSSPKLTDETLKWIRSQLSYAKEEELQIIVAGHYPLLEQQSSDFVNREEMLDLLKEYEVPLYLCGHIHQRNVQVCDSLVELALERATAYPCSYGLLYLEKDKQTEYVPDQIDVEEWALQNNVTDPNLLSFDTYQLQLFQERTKQTVEALKGDRSFSGEELEQAKEFLLEVEDGYWNGTLADASSTLIKHPGYEVFLEIADGTVYSNWIPYVLKQASPYTSGFCLDAGGETK